MAIYHDLDNTGQEVQQRLDQVPVTQADLVQEVLDRQTAVGAVQDNVDAEELRAKAAEKLNADDIDAIEEKIPSGASSSNKMATASDISSLDAAIEAILLLIPSAATSLNKLADKAFVNSSIATATATFRGTKNLVSDLNLAVDATHEQIAVALSEAVSGADNNDYAFVQVPTSSGTPTEIRVTERYKFDGTAWSYEYDLNNSGFTSDQWAAINSTITSGLVDKLNTLPSNADLTAALGILTNGIAAINEKIPTAATSSNKLVDTAAMQSYITQILDGIDATFNVTSTDGHVTIQVTQVNGVVTNVAVTTSDIASAADVAQLFQLYNALSQSEPEIIQPADTWPLANPSTTVIYRVIDRVNTPPQNYSDYMFSASDLTTPVLMATYNNAIDPRPKKGSQNLVTSGGVFDNMGAMDVSELNATENPHTPAIYADLSAALAAITSDYQKGGMSIKFVQGSVQSNDNKYVEYFLTKNIWSVNESDWEKKILEKEVADLETEVIVAPLATIPPKFSLDNVRVDNPSMGTVNGEILYYVPVVVGEVVTFHFGISSGYARYGECAAIPAVGVAVSNFNSKYYNATSVTITATITGYIAISFTKSAITTPVTYTYSKKDIGASVYYLPFKFYQDQNAALYENSYKQEVAYELGSITITNDGWDYNTNDNRVRTPQGFLLHLFKGDTVGLTSYSNARFYLGMLDTFGAYSSQGWATSDYTIQKECYCCIVVGNLVDTVQSSPDDLGKLINITRNTTITKKIGTLYDISIPISGQGLTPVSVDFHTIPGKRYKVLLPTNTWTVSSVTNNSTAVFAIRTKSNGSYTDIAETLILRGNYEQKPLLVTFTADSDISNVFCRADNGNSIVFYISEQENVSIIGNHIDISDIDNRLNSSLVLGEHLGRHIHHLNVEIDEPLIPSQSLYDIAYAKSLGFLAIEANLQVCSDGVYVIKHGGSGGTLGKGLVFADGSGLSENTLFRDITSSELRQYVTYDSQMEKYKGHIPTLSEFCEECARLGIAPFLRGCSPEALSIARKYLPDEKIIVEGLRVRGDFKGIMTIWGAHNTADEIVAYCKQFGRPFYYSWSRASQATDVLLEDVAQKIHKNGFLFGTSYISQNDYQRLLTKGLDIDVPIAYRIPSFNRGIDINIHKGNDSSLTLISAIYNATDETISIENGGKIEVNDAMLGNSFSAVCIRLRYSGNLSVAFGGGNSFANLSNWVSDGTNTIELACVIERAGNKLIEIVANETTTIYDIGIFGSIVF